MLEWIVNTEEYVDHFGNVATLQELNTGACIVLEDYDADKKRIFGSYDAAAAWIFRRGYRE